MKTIFKTIIKNALLIIMAIVTTIGLLSTGYFLIFIECKIYTLISFIITCAAISVMEYINFDNKEKIFKKF